MDTPVYDGVTAYMKKYVDSEIDRLEKEIRRLRFDLGALSGHLVLIHDRLDTLWLDAGKEDVG